MTIGIVGLGLIGGSLAQAMRARTGHRILGWDVDGAVREAALASQAVHDVLTPVRAGDCDLLLIAVPPQATRAVLGEQAPRLGPQTIVVDCCGVKRVICRLGEELAARHGFTFVGGHPMAGREYTGFASALPTLFDGASMLLVAGERVVPAQRQLLDTLFRTVGFGQVVFTTAEHHDRLIALTSQLAHLVSSAYVKSPFARGHRGFSAGSFADLTRVARLDEALWSELFLDNHDFLLNELDRLLVDLQAYREALARQDAAALQALLREGRRCKENL